MTNQQLFILSTGRSGTTFISFLFNQIIPELKVEHQKKGSRIINIVSNLPFKTNSILWILFKLYKRRNETNPKSTADPLLSLSLYKLIKGKKVNGKVIHLVRNPRSFVNSLMSWKTQSFKKIILHYLIPFWNPSIFLSDKKISFKEWLNMSKYGKFCWVWQYKNKKYYSLKWNHDVDYLLIRLEDLTSENLEIREKTIHLITDFLSIDHNKVNFAKLEFIKKNPSRKKIMQPLISNSRERECLNNYCKDLAYKFGYEI